MTLFLYETIPSQEQQADPSALIDAIGARRVRCRGHRDPDHQGRRPIFTIVELADGPDGACATEAPPWTPQSWAQLRSPSPRRSAWWNRTETIGRPPRGRLPGGGDIPAEIDMDTYLTRKKEKSPK